MALKWTHQAKLSTPEEMGGVQAAQTIILPKHSINTNADIKILRLLRRKIEFGEQYKIEK